MYVVRADSIDIHINSYLARCRTGQSEVNFLLKLCVKYRGAFLDSCIWTFFSMFYIDLNIKKGKSIHAILTNCHA